MCFATANIFLKMYAENFSEVWLSSIRFRGFTSRNTLTCGDMISSQHKWEWGVRALFSIKRKNCSYTAADYVRVCIFLHIRRHSKWGGVVCFPAPHFINETAEHALITFGTQAFNKTSRHNSVSFRISQTQNLVYMLKFN